MRNYEFDDRFFEKTFYHNVAYFAGLIVADGCITYHPGSTTLDLTLHR